MDEPTGSEAFAATGTRRQDQANTRVPGTSRVLAAPGQAREGETGKVRPNVPLRCSAFAATALLAGVAATHHGNQSLRVHE